jgi:hypothetical protein
MAITDFTLNNPLIKGYLEGTSEYVPSGELLYVHTHFISNNFLSGIEKMVAQADLVIQSADKNSGKRTLGKKLIRATNELLVLVPQISPETAPRVLSVLKDVYKISKRIIEE